MNEGVHNRPDIAASHAFRNKLFRTRGITPDLTRVFHDASATCATERNWRRIAIMAAKYTIRAEQAQDSEAIVLGLNTYAGALEMGEDKLSYILSDERAYEEMRQEQIRRRG